MNNRGVVLVTVIIAVIILAVISVGIMSLNVSQVTTGSSVVETIQAEQLATGIFYQDYQRKIDGTGSTPTSVTVGSKTYSIIRNETVCPTCPNAANQVQMTVSTP